MFGNDRDSMRRFFLQSWQKHQQKQATNALEQQIINVISEHPEYHKLLQSDERAIERDFLPDQGETNPFLHMGLHLGIREQLATNRPAGIIELYHQLVIKYGNHEAEHRMMDCLAESIWHAQRNQTAPDEQAYLDCLKTRG